LAHGGRRARLRGSDRGYFSQPVDTASGIALESIDRLKVTAASHHRAFVIEVMGRKSGYLALMSGIAGGAEVISIPEAPGSADEVAAEVRAAYRRGNRTRSSSSPRAFPAAARSSRINCGYGTKSSASMSA